MGARLRAVPASGARAGAGGPARPNFAPPRFPPDLVGLGGLDGWLERLLAHEMAIVQAPVGYGKTAWCAALIAEAGAAGWRTAWISFGADGEGESTIGRLVAALNGDSDSDQSDPAALADALAAGIDADDRPLLLVLDDIDRLDDAPTLAMLDALLRRSPAALRMIASGRMAPPLAIGDAERRGMVLRVGPAELGLGDADGRVFLVAKGCVLDAATAAELGAFLRGWPAAFRLAVRGDRAALVASIDALLAPSIAALTDAEQQMLRRCAVVAGVDGDLCQLLCGEGEGAAKLRGLAARGLPFVSVAEGDGQFILHPAFRAVLRRRLDAAEPGAAVQLHRVAARYHAERGRMADAIDHWLACGDRGDAAAHLAEAAIPLLEQGAVERVGGWLDGLPDDVSAEPPGLRRVTAWHRALTADARASAAISALAAAGEAAEARAIALVHRAYAGDAIAEVVDACDALLAEGEGLSDFAAAMVRGLVAQGALKRGLFGLVHDAVRPLLLRGARRPLDLPLALATCTRAAVSRAQGQLGEAERILRDAPRSGAGPSLATALIDAALARCCHERDDAEAATVLAGGALAMLEGGAFQDALIHAFLVAIRGAAGVGDRNGAASLIDRAELLAFARNWAPLKALCIVERARLRLPATIDPETVVAVAEEERAVLDPLSAQGRAFAMLSEMRAYEAIANSDRPRLTTVAERLLRLGASADDTELRTAATLLNIVPQLSGRCDKMVELETVRFLNHAASVGFRRTIVDVLDITGVRGVQNFCSEAYASDCFLALLKLAEPSRRNSALEGAYAAPGEAFSFMTDREIDILSALNAGESNKEIARTLQLAPETVKWHLKNIMRKLRASTRDEAVHNAATLGLKLVEPRPAS